MQMSKVSGDPAAATSDADHVMVLRCTTCHGGLVKAAANLICQQCADHFDFTNGVADFSGGTYYDQFGGPETLSPQEHLGLENENAGVTARIQGFYLPMIRALASNESDTRPVRVLDSGCGNGLSVDLLRRHHMEAWGNDISALRKWQWQTRACRAHLVVAPSQSLPFPDRYFDAVLSSGVLEHIGVAEQGGGNYAVRPLPGRDEARVSFLRELARVLRPDGMLFLDFPNGAFPIDFWHGNVPGAARFHSLREGFLPTVREIRAYFRELGHFQVQPLSPAGRLRMRQVGSHWYGRLARLPMALYLNVMKLDQTGWLAASALNPYLVLRVTRR